MESIGLRAKETTTPDTNTPDVIITDSCDEDRWSHISMAAYFKAAARGFELGYEIEDWLTAEAEKN